MHSRSYYGRVKYLILATFIVRCILALTIDLGNDEAYYFTYALQPDWNHFDHPPLVGIFIRIFTINLHWVNAFSMRLTAIIAAAAGTWIIFQCGKLLKNERTGWIAAVLYNTSIYTSIISGVFILPDSPQTVFWLAGIFVSLKLLLKTDTGRQENRRLILLGIYIGLATMCKVHGVFLWFGIFMYMLLYDRQYFRNPFLYLSVFITLIIISPIFFWNLHYHFVTWDFHSERVEVHRFAVNLTGFVTATAGQMGYNNPVNMVIYILALAGIRKVTFPRKSLHLLNWLIFPVIMVVTGISIFRNVLPHWSGPGFTGLMLIAGYVIDGELSAGKAKLYRRWMQAASALIILFILAGIYFINSYPGTLGSMQPSKLGSGDVTLDMYGWRMLNKEFNRIRSEEIDSGLMKPEDPIITNKWFPGGHILFYVGYPLHIPVIGVGSLFDLHKFAWLNRMEGYVHKGESVWYITPSNYFSDPVKQYSADFQAIVLIKKLPQERSGQIARFWYIYRLEHAKHPLGHILKVN